MKIERTNINPWILDKKNLLDELAIDIANKFWIEKSKAKDLIKSNTLSWIDSLKNELKNENKVFTEKDFEELFFSIKWAIELIKNSSKIEIQTLRKDVEKTVQIEDFTNNLEKYLPPTLIEKAKNPLKPHEHILGFALWSANSIITTVEYLYKIGKWMILAPYHLVMIISWKAETNSFKDV